MTFDEALRDIKSDEFAARVNIASDLRTFLRIAQNQEAVRTLLSQLASEEKQRRVFSEVLRLSHRQVDHRYENPWDSALTVFLSLLNSTAPLLARVAAEAAVQAPQYWWARRVADRILRESPLRSSQASRQAENTKPFILPLNLKTNAGENILSSNLVRQSRFLADIRWYTYIDAEQSADKQAMVTWQRERFGYLFDVTSHASVSPIQESLVS